MSDDTNPCAFCGRHSEDLLVGPISAAAVCLACSRRIGRRILDKAGRATVWNLEPRSREVAHLSKLVGNEIAQFRAEPLEKVTLAAFDEPPPPPRLDHEAELALALVQLDSDPLRALERVAEVLVSEDATAPEREKALRIVLRRTLLHPSGLEKLRSQLFRT